MKILQKRTSRFVASLFNGLGIIACVSVSSCSSKGKNPKEKKTDELDELKKKLKNTNDKYEKLKLDVQNEIAEWFKNNPSQTNFSLTKDILQQIFVNDVNTLKSVAQTLGFDTSDTDDEEKTDIQKWLDKLNSFEAFKNLDNNSKKAVAQKFIENGININDDEAIKNNLSSVISEVQNVEKTKNVTVKIEKEGKASIVYSDNTNELFEFNDLGALQNFVNALADKNVVEVEGESWSLVLDNDKAKICGHGVGFEYKDNFNDFLKCLDSLVKISNGFSYSGVKITVDKEGVSLGGNKLDKDFCTKINFWQNVKKYAALFGLDSNKLKIEENLENVKINDFETELKWNEVVDNATIKEEWGKIFVLTKVEDGEDTKPKTITISYDINSGKAKVDNDLVDVSALCEKLAGKKMGDVVIEKFPNWDSFKDVKHLDSFLNYVKALYEAKVYTEKIKVSLNGNKVSFGSQQLKENLVTNVDFWVTLRKNTTFFNVEKRFLISYIGNDVYIHTSKKQGNKENGVKINTGFKDFFENTISLLGGKVYPLKSDWDTIFEKD